MKKKILANQKGQVVVALLEVFLGIVVLAVLMEPMLAFIDIADNAVTAGGTAGTVAYPSSVNLMLHMVAILIVSAVIVYIVIRVAQGGGGYGGGGGGGY